MTMKAYRKLMAHNYNLDKQNSDLLVYKECSLNFMRETGINPIVLGMGVMTSQGNRLTYAFNKRETEFLFTEISPFGNPMHHMIYKMFIHTSDKGCSEAKK